MVQIVVHGLGLVDLLVLCFVLSSSMSLMPPLDRRFWLVPLVQKKHKESIVHAPLRSILSCRLCEGFSVSNIGLVTSAKGC